MGEKGWSQDGMGPGVKDKDGMGSGSKNQIGMGAGVGTRMVWDQRKGT